jgi:hypothetical protein
MAKGKILSGRREKWRWRRREKEWRVVERNMQQGDWIDGIGR